MPSWLERIFGGGPVKDERMHELDTPEAWAACLEHSQREAVFVFKHSTRCPVSSHAHAEVREYLEQAGAIPVYINYVVEARPVARQIESQTGVRHESPQIMLLSCGSAIWDASHGGVTAERLTGAAAQKTK